MMRSPGFTQQTKKVANIPGRHHRQHGVALVEVLIAFFILAIGLLGLAGLQIKSLQYNQGSYQRTQAAVATNDILDRMRLNRKVAQVNGYAVSYGSTTGGSGQAKADIEAWLLNLKNNLTDGEGEISCDGSHVCTIKVRWTDRFSNTASTKEELVIASQM